MKQKLTVKLTLGPSTQTEISIGGHGSLFTTDGSPISELRYARLDGFSGVIQYLRSTGVTNRLLPHPDGRSSLQHMAYKQKFVYGVTSIRFPTKIEFKLSISAGPGTAPKGSGMATLELLVPKRPLVSPKKPVYFPPRMLKVLEPKVRIWTDLTREPPTSFINARFRDLDRLDRWKEAVNEARRRKDVYDERYQKRLVVYKLKRKKFVDAYTKAVQPVYKVARNASSSQIREDHMFKKMILIPLNNVDLRITRLGKYFDGSGNGNPFNYGRMFGPPYRDTVWDYDPKHYRWANARAREDLDAGENPFMGVPFPSCFWLPRTKWRYDRGNLFVGAQSTWDDRFNPPGNFESLRDGVLLESLHSDIIAAGNDYVTDLDAKLVRKIYSKLKRNVVHVGNLIGERKQTFDLLLTLYKRISALILLKKGILRALQSAVSNKKAWADDVLAFKFGVEPLVSDFLSLTQHLESLPADTPIVTVRTNSIKNCSFERGGLQFAGTIEVSYVIKMKSTMEILESLKRWGLMNPLETAWELTPWSFVIDWFLPVGEYISSLTSDIGLTFVTGTRKIKLRGTFITRSPSGFDPNNPGFSKSGNQGLTGDFAGEVISRTVLDKLPDRLKIATFKSPWSWAHGIESLALIVQRLK